MASTFVMKCPKCGGFIRQSGSPSMINMYHDNFCAKCGMNVKDFIGTVKMKSTMKSEFAGTL